MWGEGKNSQETGWRFEGEVVKLRSCYKFLKDLAVRAKQGRVVVDSLTCGLMTTCLFCLDATASALNPLPSGASYGCGDDLPGGSSRSTVVMAECGTVLESAVPPTLLEVKVYG